MRQCWSTMCAAGGDRSADERALSRTLGNYGLFLASIGEGAKGVPYLRRTMETSDRLVGPESPSAGADRLNLGAALRQSGQFDEAIVRDREALAITGKTYGRLHVNYARNLDELGSARAVRADAGSDQGAAADHCARFWVSKSAAKRAL